MPRQTGGGGARKLATALADRNLSYRQAVERLRIGAHFTTLGRLLQGAEPGFDLAIDLERELGVPADSWPSLRRPVRELLRLRGGDGDRLDGHQGRDGHHEKGYGGGA